MTRRAFITLLGSAAAAWPFRGARAAAGGAGGRVRQQQVAQRVGIGCGCVPPRSDEAGYVEGQNVDIAFRWARVNTIGCPRWRPIWLAVR